MGWEDEEEEDEEEQVRTAVFEDCGGGPLPPHWKRVSSASKPSTSSTG